MPRDTSAYAPQSPSCQNAEDNAHLSALPCHPAAALLKQITLFKELPGPRFLNSFHLGIKSVYISPDVLCLRSPPVPAERWLSAWHGRVNAAGVEDCVEDQMANEQMFSAGLSG